MSQPQPWIRSAAFDGLWLLSPPFVALLLVLLLPGRFQGSAAMPLLSWVVLVVFIDVAHVYSTLFRTYFDATRRRQQARLLWLVPLGCYAAGVALHHLGGLVFWRVLAYLAVFHFIRQQYGFLRLYARHEAPQPGRWLDTTLVYYATIYPLLYWHFSPPRNFTWFVEGDFVQLDWPAGRYAATVLYVGLLGLYSAKELRSWLRFRAFNAPRNLLLLGTVLSWYFGIVYFNGDLAFTLLNVVSHGIPYLALVWISRLPTRPVRAGQARQQRYAVWGFIGFLLAVAYLEEGLWDGLVWREHGGVFGWFQQLPAISSPQVLAWVVPLLALPQATHYVLDGFIWRKPKTEKSAAIGSNSVGV